MFNFTDVSNWAFPTPLMASEARSGKRCCSCHVLHMLSSLPSLRSFYGWTDDTRWALQIANCGQKETYLQALFHPPPFTTRAHLVGKELWVESKWKSRNNRDFGVFFSPHEKIWLSQVHRGGVCLQKNSKCNEFCLGELGCLRKLGSMVSKWVISPTYQWVFLGVYNPLILTIDPNFLKPTTPPSQPEVPYSPMDRAASPALSGPAAAPLGSTRPPRWNLHRDMDVSEK